MGYLFDEECIYIGRGRVGKFKFVFVRRLHIAATLFRPEFIYYYITCFLTMLILQGKTTTWFELSCNSCAATNAISRKLGQIIILRLSLTTHKRNLRKINSLQ